MRRAYWRDLFSYWPAILRRQTIICETKICENKVTLSHIYRLYTVNSKIQNDPKRVVLGSKLTQFDPMHISKTSQ